MTHMATGPVEDTGTEGPGLGDLYLTHHRPLVRLAYLLTGSQAVAEDVVQDAFVALAPRLDRVDSPAAYLRTSVVNGAKTHHRRTATARSHFAELVTLDVSPETPVLMDAVAKLPYRNRAAIVLRFYEDRSDEEIAEILGCRRATVRSLVHRGVERLRREID